MPYDALSADAFVFRIEARNRERLKSEFVREFIKKQPEWGPLGYVTFKRTYARRLTEDQVRFRELHGVKTSATSTEEFWEAIRRVVEGTFSVLRQRVRDSGQRWIEDEAQEKMQAMFTLMWDGKFLPPGRGLGMMGTDAVEKKGSACLNNCGVTGTGNIDMEFSTPFVTLMDYSMLGVGMGFDTAGAGKVRIQAPAYVNEPHVIPDSREGWCNALGRLLEAFVGNGSIPVWDFSQIRPEGSPIHTFGGTASGPEPLRELLYGVEVILSDCMNMLITSTAIVDIQNLIGRCVVAGNVRRSAEIALGLPEDTAFLALKDPSALIALDALQRRVAHDHPEWVALEKQVTEAQAGIQGRSALDAEVVEIERTIRAHKKAQKALLQTIPAWQKLEAQVQAHPLRKYRWASNNTVMCGLEQNYKELAAQTVANGEPGYAWPDVFRNYGRLSDLPNKSDAKAIGMNPCVPAGTRILTRDGYREIQTLVGQTVDVWNGERWSPVEPKITGYDQPMVRVSLSDGTKLVCTEYHTWVLAPKNGKNFESRVTAIDLVAGDSLAKFDMPIVESGKEWPEAYTHGFYCGDGFVDNERAMKCAWLYGEKQQLAAYLNVIEDVYEDTARNRTWVRFQNDTVDKFVVRHDLSVSARLAWLAGYLDADGTVLQNPNSVCLQAVSINLAFLEDVRLMLTTLGVQAKITDERPEGVRAMPDGRGGMKDYLCQRTWRLLINASDTHRLVTLGLKTHRLDLPLKKPQRDARRFVTVESVEKVGCADVVYCFTDRLDQRGTFEGVVTANCGEITLMDGELCCLSETFPTKHKTLEEYKLTLKYAYLYAKVVSCIPTHNPTTNAAISRNHRIGISMAGIWDMYETLGMRECVRWWKTSYDFIRALDEEYSGWMGVGRSIKLTTVKPGGTVPLLLGIEGGMKMPISRHYMRTIRVEENSPLARALINAGYRVEPDLTTPRTVVVYFPCKEEKAKRVSRDVTLWEQCALFTALQVHWSDNQVSATLTFKPEEAGDIEKVLDVYTGQWKSVSFLPLWDHQYPQAPYIPCTEAEYLSAKAAISPLVLEEDVHDSEDKFCAGGLCELPVDSST